MNKIHNWFMSWQGMFLNVVGPKHFKVALGNGLQKNNDTGLVYKN